jgi:hypothetical protein
MDTDQNKNKGDSGRSTLNILGLVFMSVALPLILTGIVFTVRSMIQDTLSESSLPSILGSVGNIILIIGTILLLIDYRRKRKK